MILKNTSVVCIEFGWWDTEGRSLWFQAESRSTFDSATNWLFSALHMKPAKDVEYDADNLLDDGDEQGRAAGIVCSKKSAFIW